VTVPFLTDPDLTLYVGDAAEVLAGLPDESVHCVVTSPPYWGLRDYSVEGQLGLEATPEEYVARMVEVFREVRRVLRSDGTCWLNIGDSYANPSGSGDYGATSSVSEGSRHRSYEKRESMRKPLGGLKPKDLVGIPWKLARALQEPFYTGRIPRERDRVWLAATIDGEGTICATAHKRKDDGRIRTMPAVFITNSSLAMLSEAQRIWPTSQSRHLPSSDGHLGTLDVHRWIVHGIENKTALMRELYPYLIVKRTQALLAYNMLVLMADAKRLGKSSQAQAVRDKRELLCRLMSELNHAQSVDVPTWCVEPPPLHEQGWWLRSDIVWSKPNPMPESVTDRPTKAHEYVFLLTKSARYYWDAQAIREPFVSDHDSGNGYARPEQLSRGGRGQAEGWKRPRGPGHPTLDGSDDRAPVTPTRETQYRNPPVRAAIAARRACEVVGATR